MIKRAHKYGAVATEVDGIKFHSKREAQRYCELKLLEKAGEIRQLQLQVPFELHAGAPVGPPIGKYLADFVYEERIDQDWCLRVEDSKGFDTPLSRWKRKHVASQYGITVQLV